MKCVDPGFEGFGEVYFSSVLQGLVKAWKRHSRMTLNLDVYKRQLICNLKILRGWNRALNIVLWGVACIICIMLYLSLIHIFNNINGVTNEVCIGDYDEGVLMLMYDDVVITKEVDLLRDYHD